MPEKLLNSKEGIPKSTLSKITATAADVNYLKTFMNANGEIQGGAFAQTIYTGVNEEVLGFGMKVGYNTSNNNAMQNVIKWKAGWSNNLPYGTYKVYAQAGQTDEGTIQVYVYLNGKIGSWNPSAPWSQNCATIVGSGSLSIYAHIPSRSMYGFMVLVTRVV